MNVRSKLFKFSFLPFKDLLGLPLLGLVDLGPGRGGVELEVGSVGVVLQPGVLVLLDGADGVLDRLRSKVVGSTSFVSKPIDPEKIDLALKQAGFAGV